MRAGFFAFAGVAFDRADAAREIVAREDVVFEAFVFPFPALEGRAVFAVAVERLRAVVLFFTDLPRAEVFFDVELRLAPAFLAAVLRAVDFPFDEVVFLVEEAFFVERELLFFAAAEDFFVEELFLLADVFRAGEPVLFFVVLLFLADERELVDFLVVAIAIYPSKFIG